MFVVESFLSDEQLVERKNIPRIYDEMKYTLCTPADKVVLHSDYGGQNDIPERMRSIA